MRPFIEPSNEFHELNLRSQDLILKITSRMKASAEFHRIRADHDICTDKKYDDVLLFLKEGYMTYRRNGRRIFSYEHGDLVGVERLFYPAQTVEISSSFPVTVDVFESATFFKALSKDSKAMDNWSEYLVMQTQILSALLSTLMDGKLAQVTPREKVYNPGEVIIQEGTSGNEVYSLVKGSAKATVGGREVGIIGEDEFFGVLAALGNTVRTATVTADTPCHVLSLTAPEFIELIRYKPVTVAKMVQSMAKTIAALNQQIAQQPQLSGMETIRGG